MLRFFLHYGIHFLIPIFIGLVFFKKEQVRATLILLGGILIDIDHLWAHPIFDPNRCSIGYHFLHSHAAIVVYVAFLLYRPTRVFGLALLIHIVADAVDCLFIRF